MIYQHEGRAYAIGMAWCDFVGHAEARAYLKAARRPWLQAEVPDQIGGAGGIVIGVADDERVRGVVASAAMAIGRLFPDALIRQSLPDGRVWLARMASGVPCAGRDEILAPENVAARLADPAPGDAIMVGDCAGARLSVDDALTLYETQVADGRIDGRQARAARLQPARSPVRPLAATLMLGAILAGATIGAWHWRAELRDAQSRRETFERLTASRELAGRREAERLQQLATFRSELERRRNALAQAQEDPLGQWSIWEAARRQLPLSLNGYVPDAMHCDRMQCTVMWKSAGPRVRLIDQAAIDGRLDDAVPTASPRSSVVLPSAMQARPIKRAPDAAALQLALAQALQFEGGAAGIGAGRPDVVVPGPQAGVTPVVVGMTGELRLSASGPAAMVRASDAVRSLQHLPVRLESLHWSQLASSPALTLEGRWIHVNRSTDGDR